MIPCPQQGNQIYKGEEKQTNKEKTTTNKQKPQRITMAVKNELLFCDQCGTLSRNRINYPTFLIAGSTCGDLYL